LRSPSGGAERDIYWKNKQRSQVKKSEWRRATRECSFNDLRPELVSAIRKYVHKYDLPSIESEVLICCETTSERQKVGFLDRLTRSADTVQYAGVVVTPRWLVWATGGDGSDRIAVMSARLTDIAELRDYETTSFYRIIQDSGLQVLGFRYGASERETWFFGLGPGSAAQRFRSVLGEAVEEANTA
jgi:hypothetical protein